MYLPLTFIVNSALDSWQVRWPKMFEDFLLAFDYLTIDIFTLAPLDCFVDGANVKFYVQLLGVAALPPVALVLVLILALLLRGWRLGCATAIGLPAVWTIMEWLVLLAYPTRACHKMPPCTPTPQSGRIEPH